MPYSSSPQIQKGQTSYPKVLETLVATCCYKLCSLSSYKAKIKGYLPKIHTVFNYMNLPKDKKPLAYKSHKVLVL